MVTTMDERYLFMQQTALSSLFL